MQDEKLTQMKDQAVDLNQAMAERAKQKAEQEQREQAAIQAAAQAWDKSMRRMFKGIMPANHRRFFARAEIARQDRG
jgi:glutamyl-tRNA reductase